MGGAYSQLRHGSLIELQDGDGRHAVNDVIDSNECNMNFIGNQP
jgi:hypothetical protein